MYLLYKHKGLYPSEYRKLKIGEKRILQIFMEIDLEEQYEEKKSLYGKG
jgi:hypothetical protein